MTFRASAAEEVAAATLAHQLVRSSNSLAMVSSVLLWHLTATPATFLVLTVLVY